MNKENIAAILNAYRSGSVPLEEALDKLAVLPYEDLHFAKLDHHRLMRQGFAEVVFCQGKTVGQVKAIVERLAQYDNNILATRANLEMYQAVREAVPDARYDEMSRLIVIERRRNEFCQHENEKRFILVISAGTSDMPVAEEAAITAEVMGNKVKRVYDVGVAGIHRLLDHQKILKEANVIVVVAGMEGALASVVGGMIAKPLIAVPTSVGYGANFGGLSALLSMLNSCAAGIAVVNIDNGFGAGRLSSIINHMR